MNPGKEMALTNPASILLAEDDHELRFIIARILRKNGYQVEEISDGKVFADRLDEISVTKPGSFRIDVIVSDVYMPGGIALDALERVSGRLESLPIILITSAPDQELIERAELLGVKKVLPKPIEMSELTDLITECLAAV